LCVRILRRRRAVASPVLKQMRRMEARRRLRR